MRYGSVCSGIEAASVAWHQLGWRAAWVSEIETFPSAVIASRWPGVENLGDMTALPERILARDVEAPDVLVGGTPCQAFSVAGLRGSLSDARGNLTLTFVRIADAIDAVRRADGRAPAWIVWENVPGVLSVADNAFGAFLGGLVGSDAALEPPRGRGWTDAGVVSGPARCAAWRVLDAQHFGLAQRRRRVFVLARAGAGDWAAADALLPVIESMRWHPAPRREAGQRAAPCLAARTRGGGGPGTDAELDGALIAAPEVSPALKARDYKGPSSDGDGDGAPLIAHALRGEGFDASEDGTGRGTPLVPVAQPYTLAIRGRGETHNLEYRQDGTANALLTPNGGRGGIGVGAIAHAFDARQSDVIQYGDRTGPLDTDGHSVAVAFSCKDHGADAASDIAPTLRAMGHAGSHANGGGQMAVAFDAYNQTASDITHTLRRGTGSSGDAIPQTISGMQVRRLTPRECERLQGFPDDYTAITWRGRPASECPDGPRYKALGNSMAVPVMRYLAERIAAVEAGQ
jgi:DNA (cytosine-5)-methyltransferase 1